MHSLNQHLMRGFTPLIFALLICRPHKSFMAACLLGMNVAGGAERSQSSASNIQPHPSHHSTSNVLPRQRSSTSSILPQQRSNSVLLQHHSCSNVLPLSHHSSASNVLPQSHHSNNSNLQPQSSQQQQQQQQQRKSLWSSISRALPGKDDSATTGSSKSG